MAIIVATSFVAALLILFWGLDRAIDLRDEGFSLLCREHPELCPHPSSFGFFLAKLPALSPDAIINLRLHYVAMQMGSALILFAGFKNWVSNYLVVSNRAAMISVMVCTLFSSLLCFSIFGATLNYNGVTTFFILSSEAFLFLGLSSAQRPSWMTSLCMVASGILLGLCFFAKFSASILFYAVTICSICVLSSRGRISKIIWHLLGFVAALAIFFTFFESWSNWYSIFRIMVLDIELFGGGSHGAGKIFESTAISFSKHRFEVTLIALTMLSLPCLIWLLKRFAPRNKVAHVLVIPYLVLAVLVAYWLQRLFVTKAIHSSIVYWPAAFLGLALLACSPLVSSLFSDVVSKRRVFYGLALLAVTPLITSFGTDTPILWHALVNMAPLFLCLGYASFIIGTELRSALFMPISLIFMVAVIGVQFVNGYVFKHKECAPLFAQTERLAVPHRLAGLRLEPMIAKLIADDYSILTSHGFLEGDPILGLYDTPGLVYAVGGISPGFAWYGADPANQPVNDYFLPRLRKQNWTRLFLIIKNRENSAVLDAHAHSLLSSSGLDFPRDFELIGKSFQPYTFGGRTCFFYALKSK